MIIYEKEKSFVLITQHDHAQVSGTLLSSWRSEWLVESERKQDLIYAAYEHDRGWIDLDRFPLWNDADHQPFSFRDFPANIRFLYYVKGLNEIQQVNEYDALICSLHFTTLARRFMNDDTNKFINHEQERQTRLQKRLGVVDQAQLQIHLNTLMLCDELSLFVCMEPPGTPRDQYEWFAEGFRLSFPNTYQSVLHADWKDQKHVQLSPFPLNRPVQTAVPYKEVKKMDITKYGIAKAYHQEQLKRFEVTFIDG